ncbi:hypothetical protein [Streptomyces sp. KMM 9044]|uniref:hypothetical protein n=1 Tax=Streptomyces sp. KMM 9044 TaxID=2744474 RepID=UPI003FA71E05
MAGVLTPSAGVVRLDGRALPEAGRRAVARAEDTLVAWKRAENNKGTFPLSGGVVAFKNFVGAANERNTVRDTPVTGNTCTLFEPAGLC